MNLEAESASEAKNLKPGARSLVSLWGLVHRLQSLPGVGPKSAERLAYFLLKQPKEHVEALARAMVDARVRTRLCVRCFGFTETEDVCDLCSNEERAARGLCVVEEPLDVLRIEACRVFRGWYHVLHGVLDPLDGVYPKDLKLAELVERVKEGAFSEVILALDADLEGDTTALYIGKQLGPLGVKVTRLAYGLPVGGDIDYTDVRTLSRALSSRQQL